MYKHLYDCFKHWYKNNSAIYIYSDPHFSDLDAYKFRFPKEFKQFMSEQPELTAEENLLNLAVAYDCSEFIKKLDDMQIKNINKVCGKNDTLIILGDVGNIELVKKLKAGYKVLILGNHDSGASNYIRTVTKIHDSHCLGFETLTDYEHIGEYWVADNKLFDEVYEGTLQISPKIILSHEPVTYKYCLNIHGHDHNSWRFDPHSVNWNEELGYIGSWYNCCAEQIKYTPVNLNTLIKSGVLSDVPDIHRETIDIANLKYKEEDK